MSIFPAAANDDCVTSPHPGDVAAYQTLLHELMEIGTGFARRLHEQAQASEDSGAVVAAAVAFDRVARAVRRCIALALRLDAPVRPAVDRAGARRRIIRAVEDVIGREASGEGAAALRAELDERLDGPELEDEIGDRPVAEIVADICRDLGLAALPGTMPWKRRTPADVVALCARAAEPARAGVQRAAEVKPSG